MTKYGNYDSIAFPLGGIGAGNISIKSNGALCDFEIFNRPSRRSINPFSHFAVKAQEKDDKTVWRVLQGDFADGFMGYPSTGDEVWVYGNGKDRTSLAGIKHFEKADFSAFFPIAEVKFESESFPGNVKLCAFSPFIPMNSDDSSLPCAIFEITFSNTTDEDLLYTAALSVSNPFKGGRHNRVISENGMTGMLYSNDADIESAEYGNLTCLAPDGEFSFQEHWYRGGWFDEATTFFNDFSKPGKLKNRSYGDAWDGLSDVATSASDVLVKAGDTKTLRFIISWYVPNAVKYWDSRKQKYKPYYASRFSSSVDVARYALNNYEKLRKYTFLFSKTFENQSLPSCITDAVQRNLAILKSTTCLRLYDGTFWGWEGVTEKSGSCEGTCTHVWNYAYALPYLFPDLERGIRCAEAKYSVDCDGKMAFRMFLPLGEGQNNFRACVDGQFGTVIKIYREWKLSGDSEFLKNTWESVKRLIEYAWSEKNPDRWDPSGSGILKGRQHHTLDTELFGSSAWLEGYYIGALLAGAEMAEFMGEADLCAKWRRIAEKGKRFTESELFNGDYFIQKIDLKNKSVVDSYEMGELINSSGYWNEESCEIKYQIGDGCEIDQTSAAWHADLIGLGEIFKMHQRKSALKSIFRYNFKSMRDVSIFCRVFAADDEKGVIICSWDGAVRPAIPLTYAEETMSGFEYALACNMLQCGMEKEALEIVSAVCERYDGKRRNPFAEIECGASYARSMSSYSLLLAYSGFDADMRRCRVGFTPIRDGCYFWSAGNAFGNVSLYKGKFELCVLYGTLTLSEVFSNFKSEDKVTLNGKLLHAEISNGSAVFEKRLFKEGDVLKIG